MTANVPSTQNSVEPSNGEVITTTTSNRYAEVKLPITVGANGQEALVLYNDSLSEGEAGKTLTTRGALYKMQIQLGDTMLYAYNDDLFPRNEKIRIKLDCSAVLPEWGRPICGWGSSSWSWKTIRKCALSWRELGSGLGTASQREADPKFVLKFLAGPSYENLHRGV